MYHEQSFFCASWRKQEDSNSVLNSKLFHWSRPSANQPLLQQAIALHSSSSHTKFTFSPLYFVMTEALGVSNTTNLINSWERWQYLLNCAWSLNRCWLLHKSIHRNFCLGSLGRVSWKCYQPSSSALEYMRKHEGIGWYKYKNHWLQLKGDDQDPWPSDSPQAAKLNHFIVE